jgi:arylsulfatase A-like enzyme
MSLSRRNFLPLLAAGASNAGGSAFRTVRRPNIIMIYADDLGYGDLSCYGHPTIRTPYLDRLAARGMRFTNWYSAAPVCTPSRAALLTGRYPIRSGLTNVLGPDSEGGISARELSLPQLLRTAGYSTALVGKWHLGDQPKHAPCEHGFDTAFGVPYSNDMTSSPVPGVLSSVPYPPLPLLRNGKLLETDPDQTLLTQRFTTEATRVLQTSTSRPFFLYFAHTAPHVPLYAGPRFRGNSARGPYGDVVEEMDWSVGEIMRTLEETGQSRNTLIVFSSDNGPWLSQRQQGGSAGPLRSGKSTTWEGGMREPCIAWCPGLIPAASVNTSICNMMDLFPTFAHLAEAQLPKDLLLDGQNITPILAGGKGDPNRAFFYWNADDLVAVRRGPWKLRVQPNLSAPSNVELYNLDEDPSEQFDLAADRPNLAADLLTLMRAHAASVTRGS